MIRTTPLRIFSIIVTRLLYEKLLFEENDNITAIRHSIMIDENYIYIKI